MSIETTSKNSKGSFKIYGRKIRGVSINYIYILRGLSNAYVHAICFISNHLKIGTVGVSKNQPVQLLRWLLNFLKEFKI